MLSGFGIEAPEGVHIIDPVGFMDFLQAGPGPQAGTDRLGRGAGECCILGTACVTIRENTERPETVEVGANVLAGTSSSGITAAARQMPGKTEKWVNPFGDGLAGGGIIDISLRAVDQWHS